VTRLFDDAARAYLSDGLWGSECDPYAGAVKTLHVRRSSVAEARPWIAEFHYSRTMPDAVKEVFVGHYPGGLLAGFVVFGMGAGKAQYLAVVPDLNDGEYRELSRLWSPDGMPKNTESRLIRLALGMLRGVRLVLSYADPSRGHMGGIYQATNWAYLGMTDGGERLVDAQGRELHSKLLSVYRMRHPAEYAGMTSREIALSLGWTFIPNSPKHRYAMRLDGGPLPGLPYPHAVAASSDAADFQSDEGGPQPTLPLHTPAEASA
jgi:hypothetical protein